MSKKEHICETPAAQLLKANKSRLCLVPTNTYGATLSADVLAEIDKIRWDIRDPAL
jgi:hypothetical protein